MEFHPICTLYGTVSNEKLAFWFCCFYSKKKMPRYFSLKDVAEHSSADAPWFIIENKVYDVTKLLAEVRILN
jgi:cytochrome b involved in lipid metabolism